MQTEILVDHRDHRYRSARAGAAIASVAAGAIHVAVVPEHLAEEPILGSAFMLAALVQFAWAIAILVRPSPSIAGVGAAANGAMGATWLVSRTAGLPLGHDPWTPESIGVLDLSATLLEVMVVAGGLVLVRAAQGLRP